MSNKEKLQKLSSLIGMYDIKMNEARALGNVNDLKKWKDCKTMAKKEFNKLQHQVRRTI